MAMRAIMILALFLPALGIAADSGSDLPAEQAGPTGGWQTVVAKVAPSVVSIVVERDPEPPVEEPQPEDPEQEGPKIPNIFAERSTAPVSGTIVGAEGEILTTHFNILKAKKIVVRLADGRRFNATIKGYSARKDLALLKIDAKGLPILSRKKGATVDIGAVVAAVGRNADNSPSVNAGIVSATDRMYGQAIQTDARLNYANVGGPLVDREGNLVGVTCNVTTSTSSRWGPNSGIGFAVPCAMLDKVIPMLKSGVNEGKPGYLGVFANPEAAADAGAVIADVHPGSAAATGGLKAGDAIVGFEGKPIANFDQLRRAIINKMVGDKVELIVKRTTDEKSETLVVKITLGERP